MYCLEQTVSAMTDPVFRQRVEQVRREHPGIGPQGIAYCLDMRYNSTFIETYHRVFGRG